MIPRIAHWVWFGSELPEWAWQNVNQFEAFHPGWELHVWRSPPSDFPRSLAHVMQHAAWYSSRSDILSYWLLWKYGGVYLDTDIVTLRDFRPLLQHRFFLASCQPEGHIKPHLNCAIMGSEPGSNATQLILAECEARGSLHEPWERIRFGPDLLTRLFHSSTQDVSLLPAHYFYAIPDRTTAHAYWQSAEATRAAILARFRGGFIDNEEPFALHLWGVDGSSHRRVADR